MKALIGYTGFVGSNLYDTGEFDQAYNSKNIVQAYGTSPDLLVYAGLRAKKYLANHMPEKDKELIIQAKENIKKICPKKLVLISTIDVFKVPRGVDETSEIGTENLHAYGLHRYQLERWVRENYQDALIIRLPGLFGKNIKKNFIYDYINVIPTMLNGKKFEELSAKDVQIANYYTFGNNGFYKLKDITGEERSNLKYKFREIGFTALNFTDSRSIYQFYNLNRLWDDIQIALDSGLTLWHPATEPISVRELYRYLTGEDFVNELGGIPVEYDYRTIYSELYGGQDGYIESKKNILRQIKWFIEEQER